MANPDARTAYENGRKVGPPRTGVSRTQDAVGILLLVRTVSLSQLAGHDPGDDGPEEEEGSWGQSVVGGEAHRCFIWEL